MEGFLYSPMSDLEGAAERKNILENVGLKSIADLEEVLKDSDPDSEEGEYFREVLKDLNQT